MRTLRFASLQSSLGRRIVESEPEFGAVDSMIWVEPAGPLGLGLPLPELRIELRSGATFEVLRYLGGGWAVLAGIGRIIPRMLRDAAYDAFAKRRHRVLSGRTASCLLPTPEERVRFLDGPDAS